MTNYDVLFMHDHFVLVTTVIMDKTDDKESIELAALKRLADEYGDEFTEIVKSSKQVTIEQAPSIDVPEPTVNDIAKSIKEDADE
jgi:division protein CdvB (Snf7/Vps24/ESCRT-III family)